MTKETRSPNDDGIWFRISSFFRISTFGFRISFVAPRAHVNFFINQRLFMQDRLLVWPLVLPRSGISEVLVVALRFPVSRLEFLAEMAAAGFPAVKRIEAEQLREFHEVPHSAGVFEVLVEFAIFAGHINAF